MKSHYFVIIDMTLSMKQGPFDLYSRVGRQIDIRLNSHALINKFGVTETPSKIRLRPKDKKLLRPEELIERLDHMEIETKSAVQPVKERRKLEENFVFMRQSRFDYDRTNVRFP